MAKTKKEENLFSDLASDIGGKILSELPGINHYIDTGNLAVNYLCSGKFLGGGYPGGRITEIRGPSSGGKSLWGTNAVRGTQVIDGIPVYLDAENALNPEFAAKSSHIDPSKIVRFGPADGIDCLENVFLKIYNVIRKVRIKYEDKPLVFVYDSIGVSPSERELRETLVSEDYTAAEWKSKVGGKEQPGERAKICNRELRKLEPLLAKTNATVLIINQIRKSIGIMWGSDEVGAGGGGALEFYADVRLRVSAHKKIEDSKLDKVIGVNLKVRNFKNRTFQPFLEATEVKLFFEKGVNPISGLLTILEQAGRIEKVGVGSYIIKEPWASGKEIKFRASKTRNDIDANILYECPALIDGKNEQEVRDYLAIFQAAIDQTLSEQTLEKDLTEEQVDAEIE